MLKDSNSRHRAGPQKVLGEWWTFSFPQCVQGRGETNSNFINRYLLLTYCGAGMMKRVPGVKQMVSVFPGLSP